MTSQHDLASQALSDPSLIEEMQFLDHRIRFGPRQLGLLHRAAGSAPDDPDCARSRDVNDRGAQADQAPDPGDKVRGCRWPRRVQIPLLTVSLGRQSWRVAFPGLCPRPI
jgi:hypothetical protein